MLARHDAGMRPVDCQPRDIPGGEFRGQPVNLQAGLHRETAETIADHRKARSQGTCFHPSAPDHRPGVDSLASDKRRPVGVNRRNRNPRARFHLQRLQCLCNDWPRAFAHV